MKPESRRPQISFEKFRKRKLGVREINAAFDAGDADFHIVHPSDEARHGFFHAGHAHLEEVDVIHHDVELAFHRIHLGLNSLQQWQDKISDFRRGALLHERK